MMFAACTFSFLLIGQNNLEHFLRHLPLLPRFGKYMSTTRENYQKKATHSKRGTWQTDIHIYQKKSV
jgi:hypothetical protein